MKHVVRVDPYGDGQRLAYEVCAKHCDAVASDAEKLREDFGRQAASVGSGDAYYAALRFQHENEVRARDYRQTAEYFRSLSPT